MGAQFNCQNFPASPETILKEKFSEYQEDMRFEGGNDPYSGHLGLARGLNISSKVFKDNASAEDWISENSSKWGPAIAVKVGDFSEMFPKTQADKKLYAVVQEAQKTLDNWDKDILARVKSAKSLQKSCCKCDSKISVKHLKTNACPVCGNENFLQTETDKEKLRNLCLKLEEGKKKLTLAQAEHKKKAKPACWMVGGWCSS